MDAVHQLAVCTTSYDTAHEPVADQVAMKITELRAAFADDDVACTLFIADDGSAPGFARSARAGAERIDAAQALRLVPTRASVQRWGSKGRAVRAALAAALASSPTPDALVYVNLNLKVPARHVAEAVRAAGGVDVVVGTRSPVDGGAALGNGALGLLKSRAWSKLARAALPELVGLRDPNAPLKLMSRHAAQLIVDEGRVDGVGFDAEWLCLWRRAGLSIAPIPIVWQQRAGSRPPWELVPEMLLELAQTRRRLRRER